MKAPVPASAAAAQAWIRYRAGADVLRRVLSALGEAGVTALPVKGIVTAHALYDDVAERHPMGDIDLRVRVRDSARVRALARARGWWLQDATPRLWEAYFRVDGWEVDVECTLGPPGLCSISVDDLLARAVTRTEPLGFPHLEPEVNDHALVLCLNAFKDRLRAHPWSLGDLLRIAAAPGFDPGVLVQRAREGGIATATWLVADWLAREHGAERWAEVRDRIGRPPAPAYARLFTWCADRALSPRLAHFLTPAGTDRLAPRARALALAAAGVVRGGVLRRVRRD